MLTAAQEGDQEALDQALADWYVNAEEIADFLSAANPDNWPQSAIRPMMEAHIEPSKKGLVSSRCGRPECARRPARTPPVGRSGGPG